MAIQDEGTSMLEQGIPGKPKDVAAIEGAGFSSADQAAAEQDQRSILERMTEHFENQEKVSIYVPTDSVLAKTGIVLGSWTVQINGYTASGPCGERLDVPLDIAALLEDSLLGERLAKQRELALSPNPPIRRETDR